MTGEKIAFYLQTYGYVPWTVTIADALEAGVSWDTESIIKHLRAAQEKIDELTLQLKEKNT
jgi:hypothetical protein